MSAGIFHNAKHYNECDVDEEYDVYHVSRHVVAVGRSRCVAMGGLCYVGQGGHINLKLGIRFKRGNTYNHLSPSIHD